MGPCSLNSMPLMREMARQPLAIVVICGQMRLRTQRAEGTTAHSAAHSLVRKPPHTPPQGATKAL